MSIRAWPDHSIDQNMAKVPKIRVKLCKISPEILKSIQIMDARYFSGDERISLEDKQVWVATDEEGKIAGFATGHRGNGISFKLDRSCVCPYYRGLGIQRRFIRARCKWAKRQGFRQVTAETAPYNINSSKNFIRTGFQMYWPSRRPSDSFIYWRKYL